MQANTRGLTASLSATFEADGSSADVVASAAMEMRGPFADAVDLPLYLLRNKTAGVFAGDRYEVSLRSAPDARVRISTPSATKVYEMPAGHATSALSLHAGKDSLLCYTPAPSILQAGSALRSSTTITCESSATVIYRDVVSLGRLASGERLAFREFANELLVKDAAGGVLYQERFTLRDDDRAGLERALGGYSVIGTLLVVGTFSPSLVRDVQSRLREVEDSYAGASALPSNGGCVVKVLANRADVAVAALQAAESYLPSARSGSADRR